MESVDLSKLDKDFKYQVADRPGAGFFRRCFSCGTCTASCPVAEIDPEFNPRLIIRKALLGMKEEVLSSGLLWYCTQCYTCYARCPQDVRFTDIMAVLRDLACEEGYRDPKTKEKIRAVDTLVQKLRHRITEYTLQTLEGSKDPGRAEQVIRELTEGLKELSES